MVYEEDKILTETEAVECKIKLLSALLIPTEQDGDKEWKKMDL